MKKIMIISIMLTLSIMSCGDIRTPYCIYVDNQTNDAISITFSENSFYYRKDLDVLPKNQGAIIETEVTAVKNRCEYIGIYEGEVYVQTSSGRTLKKEIWDVKNWNCKGSFKGGWTKTFVITEDDLE